MLVKLEPGQSLVSEETVAHGGGIATKIETIETASGVAVFIATIDANGALIGKGKVIATCPDGTTIGNGEYSRIPQKLYLDCSAGIFDIANADP